MDKSAKNSNFSMEEQEVIYKNIKLGCLLLLIAILILFFPKIDLKKEEPQADFSSVEKICELATLKCYFHNVAEIDKDPDGIFTYGLFEFGKKKMWLEYDGIVKVGIKAGTVKVSEPNQNGVIEIYVPEAEVINVDHTNWSDTVKETGWFTEITFEEQSNAVNIAQEEMKKKVSEDEEILFRARENAKKLLEQYVVNVGEQIGQEYTVKWVDK